MFRKANITPNQGAPCNEPRCEQIAFFQVFFTLSDRQTPFLFDPVYPSADGATDEDRQRSGDGKVYADGKTESTVRRTIP